LRIIYTEQGIKVQDNPERREIELVYHRKKCTWCGEKLIIQDWNSKVKGLVCANTKCIKWYQPQGSIRKIRRPDDYREERFLQAVRDSL